MRKGLDGRIVVSDSGKIIGFVTGSDFCTEHECGSKELQERLTAHNSHVDDQIVLQLRKGTSILGKLFGKTLQYPRVLDRKMITCNLDQIEFLEVPGEEPEAYLGYIPRRYPERKRDDLRRYDSELSFYQDEKFVGAWDTDSFAVRVRGEKNVEMLRDFYEQMMAGKVAFAGTFAEYDGKVRLAGLILMIVDRLREEYIANIEKAQAKYESDLRLKAASRLLDLHKVMSDTKTHYAGHIWPVWADKGESKVLYRLNPGYQVKADYSGPYTFEQIKEWLEAKCSYHLSPIEDQR